MATTGLLQRAAQLFGAAMARVPLVRLPGRTVVTQPSVNQITTWSINNVRSALDEHERGSFARSAALVEAMGRDDRISGCLNMRLNALCSSNGLDFTIVAPDGGKAELAEAVEAWWFDVVPDAVLRQLLSDVVMMGFAIARKHWVLTDRQWNVSRLERWNPGNVRWNEQERCFAVQVQDGEVLIDPADPAWLVIAPGGENSWLAGAVRALGMPFVMRQWNWRDWSRFNERHGLPLIAIKEPPILGNEAATETFYQSLKRMGQSGILRLPQGGNESSGGFDATFLEAKDSAHATFQSFRADLDVSKIGRAHV